MKTLHRHLLAMQAPWKLAMRVLHNLEEAISLARNEAVECMDFGGFSNNYLHCIA